MIKICVIRGAPGAGKSTLTDNVLREYLLKENAGVIRLRWDEFYHMEQPWDPIDKVKVLNATRRLINTLTYCHRQSTSSLYIIDGVFAYIEEQKLLIECIKELGAELHSFKIMLSLEELLKRNDIRPLCDRLDSEHVKVLAEDFNNAIPWHNEVIVNGDLSENEMCEIVLGEVNKTDAENKNELDPTKSRYWRMGSFLRYGNENIYNIKEVDFLKTADSCICLSAFTVDCNFSLMDSIKRLKISSVVLKYINKECTDELRLLIEKNNLQATLQVQDEWMAPCMEFADYSCIESYWDARPKRLRRTLKKLYGEKKQAVSIKKSISEVLPFLLWKDALIIDSMTWKKDECSDMRSLDREDLQYLLPIICDPQNNSLFICYLDNIPVSFSYMSRHNPQSPWYAIKWGATPAGRADFLGIYCLIEHIKELIETHKNMGWQQPFRLDFWGRNSEIYGQLATDWKPRGHYKLNWVV